MDATQRLSDLVKDAKPFKALSVVAIQECVAGGADVMYTPDPEEPLPVVQRFGGIEVMYTPVPETYDPLLLTLAFTGHVEAFLACMESTQSIDFSVKDTNRNTVLHIIAENEMISDKDRVRMLQAVINRSVEDTFDWGFRNNEGKHFIDCAAQRHCLHLMYPIVKGQPFFADRTEPIPITSEMYLYDYELLSAADREAFDIREARVIEGEESSVLLYECWHSHRCKSEKLTIFKNYIEAGADVNYSIDSTSEGILHTLCRDDYVEAFLACMASPKDIDFRVKNHHGDTVLHMIAGSGDISDENSVRMLQAVVDRVERHPNDTVKWDQRDCEAENFLSLAVERRRLHLMYPIVKGQPFFADRTEPIPITSEMYLYDYEMLSAADKEAFDICNARVMKGSKEIVRLYEKCLDDGFVSSLKEYAFDDFNVMYTPDAKRYSPILHLLLYKAQVNAFRTCMEKANHIDFRVEDDRGDTVLHLIARKFNYNDCVEVSDAAVKEIFSALVERIESHPNDDVDWAKKDKKGKNFINLVALNNCLHLLYPFVKKLPYFAGNPVAIDAVYRFDYEKLSEDEQRSLNIRRLLDGNESSIWLYVYCQSKEWGMVDLEVLQSFIAKGGDIMYRPPQTKDKDNPILHQLCYKHQVEAFLLCMKVNRAIDFRIKDAYGATVLHLIAASISILDDDTVRMLEAVVNHIRKHPEDMVDWGAKNIGRKDFINVAAKRQRLHLLYPVVKALPYFSNRNERIALSEVCVTDYELLSEVEKNDFDTSNAIWIEDQ